MNTIGRIRMMHLVALIVLLPGAAAQKNSKAYLDRNLPVEKRIDDLLARMTVEEKVAQLQSTLKKIEWGVTMTEKGLGGVGPVLRSSMAKEAAEKANSIQNLAVEKTRLGIPVIIHDEALHGLIGNGATSFPQAIALASTWDTDLMSRVATAIVRETRSRGIRQVLSPVVNIARDARWGRVEETYGEDVFLSSRMAVAFCRPIEEAGVVTTPKHFVANFGDGGRDSYPSFLSERTLREVYFPPFEACIREAGSQSVMASYNALDGIPCSANRWLLTGVLRNEWGFKGFVVSDYGSVAGIKEKHAVGADTTEAAAMALRAGLDVELPDIFYYGTPLLIAVKDGRLPQAVLDGAVRNVLRAKFRLGLFEDPYVDPDLAGRTNDSPEHRALAREAARKAMVLLKNERRTLPLLPALRSIAVIGPVADSLPLGGYSGFGLDVVTPLAGIKARMPSSVNVRYAKGCDVGFTSLPAIPSLNLIPPDAKPGERGLRGEYFRNRDLSGPPALVRIDRQIQFEWAMGSPDPSFPPDQFSVRWTGKIVPTETETYRFGASTDDGLRLYLDGKLLIENWFDRGATLDAVTVRLESGRQYDLRMEYYENSGWAYASLGWEVVSGVDARIQEAVDAARASDVAVVAVGIIEGEGYDRASLDLPGAQERLIKAVAATGVPTVVVLINGNAVTMKNWIDDVAAVLEAWYPGEEGGNAIADVLFGDAAPGGKLPITFPQSVGQVPLYYDTHPTGRGSDYSDMSGKPLFPFGFGLSYTTFSYGDLRMTAGSIWPDGRVEVSVAVRNSGDRRGDEVVQLYVHRVAGSVTRPVKELKGFKRITLDPGTSATVTFLLTGADLSSLDAGMKRTLEPGSVEVLVGSSSDDIRLRTMLEVAAR